MENNEMYDNDIRMQNVIAEAKKKKRAGIYSILAGAAITIFCLIAYFVLETIYIFLIVIGPVAFVLGIVQFVAANKKIGDARRGIQ